MKNKLIINQFKKNLSKLKSQLKLINLIKTIIINFNFPIPTFNTFLTN